MWHWIIRARLRTRGAESTPPNSAEIESARSVLFTVFARYGDSVIAFKAIDRFMARYPGKRYLLITTHQARPYAEALIHSPLQLFSVNKRRNPLRMWQLVRLLRRDPPDIGFNPWSHGEESEYFISFCRKSAAYRTGANFERHHNLYRRLRDYLRLPDPPASAPAPLPARARRVVICPFSTDIRKSLDQEDLAKLFMAIQKRFGTSEIVVAGMRQELTYISNLKAEQFMLDKSRDTSERFVALLRTADLFIGVDAGPLHLADALRIPCVGIFGPTAPGTILDCDSRITALRHTDLDGVFCDVRSCTNPVCLHRLVNALDFDRPATVASGLRLERARCAMRPE